jgi:hypothetical protein
MLSRTRTCCGSGCRSCTSTCVSSARRCRHGQAAGAGRGESGPCRETVRACGGEAGVALWRVRCGPATREGWHSCGEHSLPPPPAPALTPRRLLPRGLPSPVASAPAPAAPGSALGAELVSQVYLHGFLTRICTAAAERRQHSRLPLPALPALPAPPSPGSSWDGSTGSPACGAIGRVDAENGQGDGQGQHAPSAAAAEARAVTLGLTQADRRTHTWPAGAAGPGGLVPPPGRLDPAPGPGGEDDDLL